MGGGAWPFLVGGVICLVNSDNERDLSVLNSYVHCSIRVKMWAGESKQLSTCEGSQNVWAVFLSGLLTKSEGKLEAITGQ